MRYKNDQDRRSGHNFHSYRDMGMNDNYYQDTRDDDKNQRTYQVLINNSRNRREQYNRDNIREDESINTTRPGSTLTCKRSHEDIDEHYKHVPENASSQKLFSIQMMLSKLSSRILHLMCK